MRDVSRINRVMKLAQQIVAVADLFCQAKGLSRGRVATLIFNDGKRLDAIDQGSDLGTRQYEKAMAWLAQHWPEGVDWPDGVERPLPDDIEATDAPRLAQVGAAP
jgi:hypothetical protein